MGKTMRIPDVFDKCHNLMLVLFMMKFSAVAIAYRALLVRETAFAKFGQKKPGRVRAPKGKLVVSTN